MKPAAYEGDQPYLFVSYAHKDTEKVFQVLDELYKRGYRIWYDEGIAPGSEWPEEVASHLIRSAMLMAFISDNSVQSENCRREINFALSKKKPFLSIILEKTEIPLGMEMQLSSQQSILRYNFETWDGFINKILKCPSLEPCKGEETAPKQTGSAASSDPGTPTLSDAEKEAKLLKLNAQAVELHNKGNYQEEIQILLSCMELDPKDTLTLTKIGRAYRLLGYPQKALDYYEKAKAIDPEYPYIYLNTAAVYLNSGNFAAAKSNYEQGLRLFEKSSYGSSYDHAVCYGNYALCLGRMGDLEGARKNLKIAKEKGYSEANLKTICSEFGIDPLSLDKEPAASPTKERKQAEVLNIIVKAEEFRAKEDYNMELQTLVSALELDPDNYSVLIKIGRAYRNLGYRQKALDYYEKARVINPNDPTLYGNIGAVYASAGEYIFAKPYYEKCLALIEKNPLSTTTYDNAVSHANYALCLGKTGNTKEAKQQLKTAREKGYPEDKINSICQQININPKSLDKKGLFW